ncbi:ImmA/IrrE family metallo-endopeptidase [Bacillus paralicheniformis]|uniref:ImmA/IrrE family metallo-endopeptidase n=1 Tax=Bacillus paralicheniformis TaxID=1648923 RepID=UPI003B9851A8
MAKLKHPANTFATELLITDKMLMDEMPRIKNWTHKQIASFFKVPLFIIEYKISQLNFLSPKTSIEERHIVNFA